MPWSSPSDLRAELDPALRRRLRGKVREWPAKRNPVTPV